MYLILEFEKQTFRYAFVGTIIVLRLLYTIYDVLVYVLLWGMIVNGDFLLLRYLAKSFTVILPYFPTGTMERVDTEGQIATAKVLFAKYF